jgi:Fur family transcriptional regulator, ferric uptake regulator
MATTCQHPGHKHPEHRRRQAAPDPAAIEDAVARLRARGLRRTRLLDAVLCCLAASPRPLTIGEITTALDGAGDPASVYRMIERLVQAAVVRRLGLQERALYYQMILPGHHCAWLICQHCGAIGEIDAGCPVAELEHHLAAQSGYSDLQHELTFYGTCPECRKT